MLQSKWVLQALKFFIPLIAIMGMTWSAKTCWNLADPDPSPLTDTFCAHTGLLQLLFAVLLVTGTAWVFFYLIIATRQLYSTLGFPVVLILTGATSVISTAYLMDWHWSDLFSGAGGEYIFPLASIATVTLRYLWVRIGDWLRERQSE